MSSAPPVTLKGKAYQRPATLTVDGDVLQWRARRGQLHPSPEEFDIPRGSLRLFALSYQRWTSVASYGVILIALGALWRVYQAASLAVSGGFVGVGLVLIAWRRFMPRVVLTVQTFEHALLFVVRRSSLRECEEVVADLQRHQPGLAGEEQPRLLPTLGRQIGVLFRGEASLRAEYRALAGDDADPLVEARYVRASRRASLWTVGWFLVAPIGGSIGLQLALPPEEPKAWAFNVAVRAILFCLVGAFVQGWLVQASANIRSWLEGER